MLWIGIISLAARHDQDLYRRIMAYPDDLPDLRGFGPLAATPGPKGLGTRPWREGSSGELDTGY